ncbi:DUF202 domain-containing protein [Arthrobacter sp. GMC3]|uniref:DUF202 domain-containing protein n=1 Tax=Arthrobacter sp. GMC3 TaxID=2058894 RepID=UPI000CE56BD9|nr:DUF202 domain-containing protein [Arthrobacter sp. GMC3]
MDTPALTPRDPGLQPERTALAWRRTIMSAVVASILIWRGWWSALAHENSGTMVDGLITTGHSAHVIGLGICAMVACLTTVTLVVCAVLRIRLLHAGVADLERESDIGPSALMLRTGSAAIVALAVAAICAIALGM